MKTTPQSPMPDQPSPSSTTTVMDSHVHTLDAAIDDQLKAAFAQEPLPDKDFSLLLNTNVPPVNPTAHTLRSFYHHQQPSVAAGILCIGILLGAALATYFTPSPQSESVVLASSTDIDTSGLSLASRPMQDAVNIHRMLTTQAASMSVSASITFDQWDPGFFPDWPRLRLEINNALPDLADAGFTFDRVQAVASPFGAAFIVLYQHPTESPLSLFVRQDQGQRVDGIHWRHGQSLNVGFFYRQGTAIAVTHANENVVKAITPSMYETLIL